MARPPSRSTMIRALGFCAVLAFSSIVAAGTEDSPSLNDCSENMSGAFIGAAEAIRLTPNCSAPSVSTVIQGRVTAHVAVLASPGDAQPEANSEAAPLPSALREPLREGGHAVLSRFATAAVEWLAGTTTLTTPALIEVEVLRALLAVRLDLWLDGASIHQRSAVDQLIRARAAALLPTVLGEQVGGLAAALISPTDLPDVMVRTRRVDLPSDRAVEGTGSCATRV